MSADEKVERISKLIDTYDKADQISKVLDKNYKKEKVRKYKSQLVPEHRF